MRWLSNPVSGSIAGSGGVLLVLLVFLNIILVELNDNEAMFLLVFILIIPFYILILPLISLIATLIDNTYLGSFKEGIKSTIFNTLIGSTVFVILLLITIFLVLSDDGINMLTDTLGVSAFEILILIIITNLISTTIGSIINGYRPSHLPIDFSSHEKDEEYLELVSRVALLLRAGKDDKEILKDLIRNSILEISTSSDDWNNLLKEAKKINNSEIYLILKSD